MPNRRLTPPELNVAEDLLQRVRSELREISGGDRDLLFAYRRKIYKELTYDERSKPTVRRRLKQKKFEEQSGICPLCEKPLPRTYAVLDRFNAVDGYTPENTRLVHQHCDVRTQSERSYG